MKLFFISLLLIVLTSGITLILSGAAKKSETTIHVDQIQELAMLATAKAKVTLVKEEIDHELFGKKLPIEFIPGTKRELLLIIPATVIAGVDLKEVTSDEITINEEEKKLEIILPRATFLGEPAIDMDQIKTFSSKGLFTREIDWNEGFDLAAVAQNEIETEAIEMGLLESAEENAEKLLESFFNNLDYRVKVIYE